mmetsp:Transcript_69318/g.122390  ORF Transcript_69318/g.122390 Transcript_69318/m.122390 type:complete len:798 (+) Transcript_69318:50-2443(+)
MPALEEFFPAEPLSDEEAREWLAARGVPEFIDEFIGVLIAQKNAGTEITSSQYMKILNEVLDRHIRKDGKGAKAIVAAQVMKKGMRLTKGMKNLKAPGRGWAEAEMGGGPLKYGSYGGEEMGVPAYCKRDPIMRPSENQIVREGVTTWKTTRSKCLQPHLMKDYASTVAGQFNYGAAKCIQECKAIQEACKSSGKPFFDEAFWFGKRDSMYPKGVPSDCTVTEPKKAMRAKDMYPGAPLFVDGADSNDIIQGAVGDCFFIGAASALASCTAAHLKPMQRLFVFSDIANGIYGVMWCKNGGWEWVIVDDWIAYNDDGRGNVWPQYSCPGDKAELWPLIIEKAYAKIHYCWDSIDGGWARQALEDLTGGMGYTLNLAKGEKYSHGGTDFSKFKAIVDDPLTILGCAVGWHVRSAGGGGRAGEQGAIGGLYKGHAYSVIKFAVTSDGKGFVRVRNPWGNEAEWNGDYSDNSREWRSNPSHQRELQPEFKNDGAFWMTWDDFRKIFTDIDVVRFFPYEQVVLCMNGTAPRRDICEENTYILKVGGSKSIESCVFALGQDDLTIHEVHAMRKRGRMVPIQISVYSLDRLPGQYNDLQDCLGRKIQTPQGNSRTVFTELNDLKPGYYSIVPYVRASGRGYSLRVFASPGSDVSMWRFSGGEASALSVEGGSASGTEVPAVAVPTSVGGEAAADVKPEVPAKPEASGEISIYKAVGCEDKTEFNRYLQRLFQEMDYYRRGKVSERQTKQAFEKLVMQNDNTKKVFDEAWDKVNKTGSSYFYADLAAFKELVGEFTQKLMESAKA